MDRAKFIKHVKKGTRLRIDEVKITTNVGELTGKGRLHCKDDSFNFRVTLDLGQQVPKLPPGIYGRKDFWSLSGTIEDHLPFKAVMGPLPGTTTKNNTIQLRFGCDHIDLEATGWDSLTSREVRRLINRLEDPEEANEPIDPAPTGSAVPCDCHFKGWLNGFELIDCDVDGIHPIEDKFLLHLIKPNKTVLSGSLGEFFEFALFEEDDGLEFHLQSKANYKSSGEQEDLKHLNAFLNALGFVFGRHPWHFLLEFRRDGKLILDRVRPNTVLASIRFTPFNDKQFHAARFNKQEWSTRKPISLAYTYFLPHSDESREMSNFLYHFREGAKRQVHTRIAATVLCPFLENLIRNLAHKYDLRANKDSIFEKVKAQTVEALKLKQSQCTDDVLKPVFDRFIVRCANMDEWDMSQLFRAVTDRFGLAWDPRWKHIYSLWKKHRNLVLHRGNNDPDDDYRGDIEISSRIAGAINVLVLKTMGFSGQVRWSAYNDDYGMI
jgi:hypothetical protein